MGARAFEVALVFKVKRMNKLTVGVFAVIWGVVLFNDDPLESLILIKLVGGCAFSALFAAWAKDILAVEKLFFGLNQSQSLFFSYIGAVVLGFPVAFIVAEIASNLSQ